MRPPSYYASIVKSNTSAYGSGSYSSSSTDSYATPRTPSQQLRSSLSSPSSSNYVSRSHLPFVPQSTLVAHCFTGVGSSTRPYGSSTSTASSYRTSRGTSPAYSRSSSASSYTPSRPPSTNRRPAYTSPTSTASSGYSASPSYLSPASAAMSTSANYPRPTPRSATTTSSYYKPIRLRERPLLTQISRQFTPSRAHIYTPTTRTRTTTTTTTPTSHSTSASEFDDATKSELVSDKENKETSRARLALPSDETKATNASQQDESNWSSDIGRNISRNKYLIKFREFDKHTRPSVDVEATIQLPPVEVSLRDTSHDRDSCVPDRETSELAASLTIDHTMRLPTPEPLATLASETNCTEKGGQARCDIIKRLDAPAVDVADVEPKPAQAKPRERKNVKLKLKPIGGLTGGKKKQSELANATAAVAEATTTTTVTDDCARLAVAKKHNVDSKDPKREESESPLKTTGPKEAKKLIESPDVQPAVALTLPEASGRQPVNVASAERKAMVKTSVTKVEKTNEANKSVARQTLETDIPVDPVAEPSQSTPFATTKVRRGSKAAIVTEQQQQASKSTMAPAEAEAEKPKTKIIKKKKKTTMTTTKQEDENAPTPSRTTRRKSSVAPKETAAQVNELQVTPATPEFATPAMPSKQQPSRIRFREYNINDFNFLTVLGHGGWGFVILAELKEHDACFAVKCIKKITIVEDDDYDSIMIERKVLTLGNIHPFICKLFCTFETPGYLFFVMEYCAGGDLMFHVQHEGKFTESRCRFYAAEIICAIRFLHNRHIIYRDLKLDNILLDARGHIRLVDFGMCQCRTYREEMLPSNFCGTPEYISPEIIKGVPYNHSVDWWSFGVLLYEMAVGKMPFRGNDENELLWNVCYEQIHYPMFLTKELTSILKSLLEREPTKRMGMATCKAGDIYDQPFFRCVDWKAVEELRVEPPFVPEVRSNRDVSNFDSDFTESTCELSPVDESTLARIDQKQFEKFPYTNPDIFVFDPTQQQQNVDRPRGAAIP